MKEIAYIITAASVVGTVANSFKKRWCFIVWGVTNTFWIFYNIIFKNYAQAILYVFNLIMAIVGFIKWRDKPTSDITPKQLKKILGQLENTLGVKLFEWQKDFFLKFYFATQKNKPIKHKKVKKQLDESIIIDE